MHPSLKVALDFIKEQYPGPVIPDYRAQIAREMLIKTGLKVGDVYIEEAIFVSGKGYMTSKERQDACRVYLRELSEKGPIKIRSREIAERLQKRHGVPFNRATINNLIRELGIESVYRRRSPKKNGSAMAEAHTPKQGVLPSFGGGSADLIKCLIEEVNTLTDSVNKLNERLGKSNSLMFSMKDCSEKMLALFKKQ